MSLKSIRKFSNLIIVFMLAIIIIYLGASSYSYAFAYQNEDVIYNGNRNSNKVSIMFNVYWGTEYIDDILDLLDLYQVKSTFFVGGIWAEKEQSKLIKIYERGHEIANHGYFHKDQEYLDYSQNYEEINVTHKLISSITNYEMNLFAPPSGSFNKATIDASKALGYTTIMWSKDTIDWRDKDANIIFERATSKVTGGELILAHPTEMTLKALPLILEFYKLNNLKACTVSENLQAN